MTSCDARSSITRVKQNWSRIHPMLRITALLGLTVGIASCASQNRVVFNPPNIPGAEYVGSEECSLCHEEISNEFRWAPHARLMLDGETGLNHGCESCHGAGSIHSEEGGSIGSIHNPGRNPAACLECHTDVASSFRLPHGHQLGASAMTCIDCHDPHGGEVTAMGEFGSFASGKCAECHTEQSRPHVFEHEAMREGCEACHTPHGSVNDKMLRVRNSNLCLQCHYAEDNGEFIMIGEVDHTGFGFLARGSCWSAGCHEAVHGSNVNSSLRF